MGRITITIQTKDMIEPQADCQSMILKKWIWISWNGNENTKKQTSQLHTQLKNLLRKFSI